MCRGYTLAVNGNNMNDENKIALPINKRVIMDYFEKISDPEVPVLSIIDLGIVRAINFTENILGDN